MPPESNSQPGGVEIYRGHNLGFAWRYIGVVANCRWMVQGLDDDDYIMEVATLFISCAHWQKNK